MQKVQFVFFLSITILATFFDCHSQNELTWHASGNGGVVAAGPEESALAGLDILSKGGNAVDGAVAVIFNHAVSDYGMFSIGGEVPFMFYNSVTGNVLVFNGMGGAPLDQKAIDWYYENGIPDRRPGGIKTATVPSAISTCLAALEMKGTMSFEQVVAPALKLLDKGGKEWYDELAVTLRRMIEAEQNAVGTREQKIRAARDRFYKGDIADELNDYYVNAGGFLRKADLEAHETVVEEPVTIRYRGYTIHKCNTWTQGPVLLQSLRLLEKFDLKAMGYMSADYIHTVTEAMKLAFADRDKYYGDPRFVQVPLRELLSDEYTSIRLPLIDSKRASKEIRPGDPYKMEPLSDVIEFQPGEKGTTTCVVVDEWGNVVAATPSSNPVYGICESLGIAHNTRLNTLNTQKGHPNAIEAGKRPRITLTPTIVMKDGAPVLALSVAGGDMQDQVTLQLLLDFTEFGKMPAEAITSPRFQTLHTEDSFTSYPDPLKRIFSIGKLEINQVDQSVIDNLTGRGHEVSVVDKIIAYPVMVYIDQTTGISYAASQPRKTNSKFSGALKRR